MELLLHIRQIKSPPFTAGFLGKGRTEKDLGVHALVNHEVASVIFEASSMRVEDRHDIPDVGQILAEARRRQGASAVAIRNLHDVEVSSNNGGGSNGFVHHNAEPGEGGLEVSLQVFGIVDYSLQDSAALGSSSHISIDSGSKRIEFDIARHSLNYTPSL